MPAIVRKTEQHQVMKIGFFLLCIFAMLFSKSFAAIAEPDFSRCRKYHPSTYTITPYLEEAVWLQSLPRDQAIGYLRKRANEGTHEQQVIILCRMLFEARPGEEFRRAVLGLPSFLGARYANLEELFKQWPLEPITLVDDIPFVILWGGYAVAGGPSETSSHYLEYCVEHTNWSSRRYKVVDKKQIEAALGKLLQRFKNTPLYDFEIEALQKQIQ
ncbi:MAG: hypothetical protein ABIP97_09970 [Chthoniobacterales bacterium]